MSDGGPEPAARPAGPTSGPTCAPTCSPPGAAPGLAYTLTFFAIAAHNFSGLAAGLPGWAAALGFAANGAGYANAVLYLTLAAAVVLLVGRTLQFNRPVQIAVAVLCGGFLAQVAVLVAASLFTWSAVPGLFTAILLVAPGTAWLILRLPLDRRTRLRAGLAGAALMPLVAALVLRAAG